MRLESDGLLKVDADSLVGARAYTPVGWGAVMSARDVWVRYEVETVRTHKSEAGVGELTAGTTSTTYSSTGDGANFNVDEGQLTVLGDKTGGSHHARTTDTDGFDGVSPRVVEQRATGSSGSLWEEEINRRTNESGDQNEDGVEPPDRRKRQDEGNEDEQRPPTVFKSCLNERVIHVASRKGPPGESGAYCQVGDDDGRTGSDDALEGCSEGTERAAELDEWAAATEHGGTRENFTPTQVGAGSWTAHEGTSTAANARAIFSRLDSGNFSSPSHPRTFHASLLIFILADVSPRQVVWYLLVSTKAAVRQMKHYRGVIEQVGSQQESDWFSP